jgi:predicted esterase YcpF (UPF0227 family)
LTPATIVYLHGFRSSSASVKATQFRQAVDAIPVAARPQLYVPDLPHRPAAAIAQVDAWVEQYADARMLTLVGSSLGGYYATHLAERYGARAAMINPAIRPYEDLRPYVGTQTNMYSGATFDVTPAHFDELAALRIDRITTPSRYLLLVQTGDEILDWRHAIAFYAGAWQYVEGGGDHAFQRFDAQIPAVLRFAGVESRVRDDFPSGHSGPAS